MLIDDSAKQIPLNVVRWCRWALLRGNKGPNETDKVLVFRSRQRWDYTPSTKIIREIMDDRMYPLTVAGLDEGMKALQ